MMSNSEMLTESCQIHSVEVKRQKSYSVVTTIRAVAFLNCFNEAWQTRPMLCSKTHGQIPTPLKLPFFLILVYFRWQFLK